MKKILIFTALIFCFGCSSDNDEKFVVAILELPKGYKRFDILTATRNYLESINVDYTRVRIGTSELPGNSEKFSMVLSIDGDIQMLKRDFENALLIFDKETIEMKRILIESYIEQSNCYGSRN